MIRIGILTTDTDLAIKTWDSALETMTGIPADRVLGRHLEDIVPDLAARGLLDLIREPLISGSAQVLAPALHKFLIPCPPLHPSEEFEHMQQRVVVGALRDEHQAVGLVVSIEDVTERLEQERRLARQLRESTPRARLEAIEQFAPLEGADGLEPLAHAMADDDWRVRRAAVRALAARRDAALVDAVVSALRDGHRNFSLLSSALQLLTLTGVDFTEALIHLLQDPDPDLRIQAALALGTQQRPTAIDSLLAAVNDSDPNVRFHAIESLGKLAPPAAIDLLAQVAESGDFYLAFPAIEALVRINDPIVAGRLTPLLRDAVLGTAAAEALGKIGDEDVVPPLAEALGNPSLPVQPVVHALTQIHDRYQTAFAGGEQIADLIRRHATDVGVMRVLDAIGNTPANMVRPLVVVLGWLRDPAIPASLARLLGSHEARHDVIEAFVRHGSSAVMLLIDYLTTGDQETRRSAVVALGRIGDRRAVPALIERLKNDDRELRLPIVAALARLGDVRAFEALLGLLGDDDIATRQAVIGALNSIGHPEMAARILPMLADANPLVRESAVKIAGYFGYESCITGVLACCADPDEAVRAAALEHLPYFDDPRALPVLRRAIETDTPVARAAAAKALAFVTSPDVQGMLERATGDPEPWVRYFSTISLGRQQTGTSVDTLARVANHDPAPHVRVAAVEAIGAIDGPLATDVLIPLAARADDSGLAAIGVLGRSTSDEALATLTSAVRSDAAPRRIAAIAALAARGDEHAVQSLQWAAVADEEPSAVQAALIGLGTIASRNTAASRSAVRALLATLADPGRRSDAIAVLGRLAPSAIPLVAESLSDDDPRLRRGVVEVLSRLSHPAASASLQRALHDGDAVVRRKAVHALSRFGTIGLQRRFSTLATTDPAPAVRQAAAAALSRQPGVQERGE
jgi:HEAT repeat protein